MTTTTTVSPDVALTEIRGLIEDRIRNQPRSLQKAIGPSEIGTTCDHCLGAKLAGWAKTEDGVAWLPYVGTAMHAQLEYEFTLIEGERAARDGGTARWLIEQKVMVGHIGGQEVWGSTDLFDAHAGMTVDWKLTGATTLRNARKGPSQVYRVQAHLYAKGWEDAGHTVHTVAVYFLPRNAVSLDQGITWHEPYDRAIAEEALDRANRLHANLTALASVSEAARDAWITSLPRAEGCYDCPRYPDGQDITKPGHRQASDSLAGLIPPIANPATGSTTAA